jgi:NADPH:quinone reductase-like Zn-dependent oxidoreductase
VDFEAEILRHTKGHGVDVILDGIGGSTTLKSYRVLAPLGRLVYYASAHIVGDTKPTLTQMLQLKKQAPRFDPDRLMLDSRTVSGLFLPTVWAEPNVTRQALTELSEFVVSGKVHPIIDRVFPFEEAPEAHIHLQRRRNIGKVVLRP